nr:ATP synthase subunit f, mitochondrial-like isoform X2 [Paramormyrops kingsleyae]
MLQPNKCSSVTWCLAERAFVDVRLAELPSWLMSRPLPSPRAGVASLQRGWRWYYSRYIDVRRGGVGGVAMLLTTYCVLSYLWSYPRLKEERWRKYH